MGSPTCIKRTPRIHTVRTIRGAAMILNKVLHSAGDSKPLMDAYEYIQLIERTIKIVDSLGNHDVEIICPTWANNDWYTLFGEPFEATQHGYTIITAFLQAIVDCRRYKRAEAIYFGANYAWVGSGAFECVVIIDL